jgi:hypothetical protein
MAMHILDGEPTEIAYFKQFVAFAAQVTANSVGFRVPEVTI